MMHFILTLFLFASFLFSSVNGENTKANDAIVARLRGELAAEGVNPIPDPPRQLGIHAACLKHGMGCPDSYVEFLQQLRKETGASSEVPKDYQSKTSKLSEATQPHRPLPQRTGNKPKNHRAPNNNDDIADQGQLENMRRLRNVLRERLDEQVSPEGQWRCQEARWLRRGLNVALAIHEDMVEPYWGFIMFKLLPCSIFTAIVSWIFFGDRIPREHLCGMLSDDPTFALKGHRERRKASLSVSDLIIERESYNLPNYSTGESEPYYNGGEGSELRRMQEQQARSSVAHRRDRWCATRFALLESHEESCLARVVLKLRLALSAAAFVTLVWTLFSLPATVAGLQGAGGLLQRLLAVVCPAWVTTSLALYFGWSWVGGMVAYAGWELVSAGEALLRSGEREAALHEQILQRWHG